MLSLWATVLPLARMEKPHVGGNDEVELAYVLMPEFWGKGLATEIAQVSLKVAFEQLGLADVVCFTMTTNRASQLMMEKVGFKYERDIVRANLPHVFYRITADEWSRIGRHTLPTKIYSNYGVVQDAVDNAVTILKGIISGLPATAKLIGEFPTLLPLIAGLFGL